MKLLLRKFHRADRTLRSQTAGGVGVCASVAPPAFGCRLGWVVLERVSLLLSQRESHIRVGGDGGNSDLVL